MKHFTSILYLLKQIYSLLITDSTSTKRELYYKNQDLFRSQSESNAALNAISCLLDYPLWKLGVVSSPKGLIAGNLKLVYDTKETIFTKEKGATIPADLSNVKKIVSDADFILVVEKDTVFQRLIDDDIFNKFEQKMLLVTVSSYPEL